MWEAVLIATAVGVLGTGAGVLVGFIGKASERTAALGMALAAGVMITVSAAELLPDAYALSHSGAFWGFMAGIVFAGITATLIETAQGYARSMQRLRAAGIMTVIAIGVHNLPEGMAIGAGMATGKGIGLAITLMLHDIPEGMAIGIPLRASGTKKMKTLFWAVASGLPTGVGAIAGKWMDTSVTQMAVALAFAAGAMLTVTTKELLPVAKEMGGKVVYSAVFFGAMLGLIAILLV